MGREVKGISVKVILWNDMVYKRTGKLNWVKHIVDITCIHGLTQYWSIWENDKHLKKEGSEVLLYKHRRKKDVES